VTEAEVQVAVRLLFDGRHDAAGAVPGVEGADPAREVDEGVAVDVGEERALGAGDGDGRDVGEALRRVLLRQPHELPAPGARHFGLEYD